ncbi:protein of unknown function [Xenorhabdus nematophila AN6/1]|nr:hypothetical protein XNA1_2640010 [Xenorhabdus nematophila str. Anatoliense]CEK25172.1 protein of unknown function [Xenorhabdus nematophila AN6/1]
MLQLEIDQGLAISKYPDNRVWLFELPLFLRASLLCRYYFNSASVV